MKYQNTYASFRRLQDFPLDPSCIFETLEAANAYIAKPIAYSGQVIAVYNDPEHNGIYNIILDNNVKTLNRVINEKEFNDLSNFVSNISDIVSQHTEQITDIDERLGNDFADIRRRIDLILNNDATELIDSLKEISDWIYVHKEEFDLLKHIHDDLATKTYVDELVEKSKGERLVTYDILGEVDDDFYLVSTDSKISEIKVIVLTDGTDLSEFTLSSGNNELFTLEDVNITANSMTILSFYEKIEENTFLHIKTAGSSEFSAKVIIKFL